MTFSPFEIIGQDRPGPWVISCDHAASAVPPFVNGGDLGVDRADMARHIAYDVGIAGVTRELSRLLDSPAILTRFSRLVIDPNRGADDPTLIMRLYDGTIIPANRHLSPAQRDTRLSRCYRPYHDALGELLAGRRDPALLAMHSFTPQLRGRAPRPWHVGVLFAEDERLSRPFIDALRAAPDLCVGENEPYGGHLPGDSVDRHAIQQGRLNVLVELRNDLIETAAQQRAWAERLAAPLQQALATARPPVARTG